MEQRIPATRLARGLGDVLARIRYRGESFVIEKNGVPVARMVPVPGAAPGRLADVVRAWKALPVDPTFARDLEAIGAADAPAEVAWD